MLEDLRRRKEELLASAYWHAGHEGWPVFPSEAGGKAPAKVPEHGFLHGFQSATRRADLIGATWIRELYNVSVATGVPGPDVFDVDVRARGNGWAAYDQLKRAGLLRGAFRLVRTPSGGLHVYFAGTDQRCGSLNGLYVDFKAAGGYVLVPPSEVDGRPYELIEDRPPTGATFDWEAAKRLLRPPGPVRVWTGRRGSVTHLPEWLAGQPEGNRNKALYWAACRATEARDEAVVSELIAVAVSNGLSEAEAVRTAASAVREVMDGGQ
jgi:hypothetical protein